MLAKNYAPLVSIWLALSACNSGIDTIAEDPTAGSNSTGGAGKSSTSGSGGSASSGTAGSDVPGAGGSDSTGASGSEAGGDVTAGGAGGGGGAAGQTNPVEGGVDAQPDAGATANGLGAYWKLDEASGNAAADSSGHNHTATVVGATFVTGKVGAHAANFNGTSAYAEATGPVVDTTKPYTVAAWVQLTAVTGFKTAVSIDGASVSAFFLQLRGDSGGRFGFSALPTDAPGTATFALGKTTPMVNTWYHIAGVFDGANLKLYVNGVPEDSKPFATAWAGKGSTAIGRGFYGGARADFGRVSSMKCGSSMAR